MRQSSLEPLRKRSKTSPIVQEGFASRFRQSGNYGKERSLLFALFKEEENRFRELFAQDRSSCELDDPFALLIDVFEEKDIFKSVSSPLFSMVLTSSG